MYPDFLVIGAQKAGTTWLDRNLRCHPQIWLPPEKEIHYFDLPRPLPFAALRLAPVRAARSWAKARLERDYAKVKAGEQSLSWYLRYYFLPRTKCWYRSLFTPGPGQICGEGTPRYATLPDEEVAKIHRMMPDLKLIYLLRDPIDRMWSDLAMFQRPRFGGRGLRRADQETVRKFLANPENLAHSRYATNLARWEKYFGPDRIFVGFQEEIAREPEDLLRRILRFLGVDAQAVAEFPQASSRINSKKYPRLRPGMARHLARRLASDTAAIHQRLATEQTATWWQRNEQYRMGNTSARR